MLDLGNGDVWCVGTAADMLAAAEWLGRNYPERSQDPPHGHAGPVLNMTNYGALAILALLADARKKVPSGDEAELRWLIALETVTPDGDGWRHVGAKLLAEQAGLSYNAGRKVRDRLIAARLVDYQAGNGYGHRSAYRLRFDLKVPSQAEHLYEDEKVPSQAEHLASVDKAGKGATAGGEKVPRSPRKGATDNPLTSENENTALEASALGTSALLSLAAPPTVGADPREERDDAIEGKITKPGGVTPLAERIDAAVGCTVENAQAFIEHMRRKPNVRSATALLNTAIGNGTIADLYAEEAANAAALAELFARADRPRPTAAQPEPDVHRLPPEAFEPTEPRWKQVECPACKAPPGAFCRNPATGTTAATHAERRQGVRSAQAEAVGR